MNKVIILLLVCFATSLFAQKINSDWEGNHLEKNDDQIDSLEIRLVIDFDIGIYYLEINSATESNNCVGIVIEEDEQFSLSSTLNINWRYSDFSVLKKKDDYSFELEIPKNRKKPKLKTILYLVQEPQIE